MAVENNKNVFANKHIMILKIIFTDVCINISKVITCKHIFPSIANLKCTPASIGIHVSQFGNTYFRIRC